MICSSIEELRETDITLGKPRRVGRGTFACSVSGNGDALMSQTAVCRMRGGLAEALSLPPTAEGEEGGEKAGFSREARLDFGEDLTYSDFVDTLATTIAESLPSTLTELLYDKDELTTDDIETLLKAPFDETGLRVSIRFDGNNKGDGETGASRPLVTIYDRDSRVVSLADLTQNQMSGDIMCILHVREAVCTEDDIRVELVVHQLMCLEEPVPDAPRNLFQVAATPAPTREARADSLLTEASEDAPPSPRNTVVHPSSDGAPGEKAEADAPERTITISLDEAPKESDASDRKREGETAPPEERGEKQGTDAPGLEPVEIEYSELDEKVELKDKKKVYRELYHSALKEAKIHQQNAIKAYLQAKQIKHEYFEDDSDLESLMSFDEDAAEGLAGGGRARLGTEATDDTDDRSVATGELDSDYESESDEDDYDV